MEIKELQKYKHKFDGVVKFDEVDSFGVVHNVKYFYWLEWARTNYFETIGIKLDSETFSKEFPVMVVHNEMDYFASAKFNQKFNVYSRISKIKNSSLIFENIITIDEKKLIAKAMAVLVHLDKNNNPERIPEKYRKLILDYEGQDIEIAKG